VRAALVAAGFLLAAGMALQARLPVDGAYLPDVLPAIVVTAAGLGLGFVSATIAATTGVDARQQGLASGLLNTSQQIGGALGLAVLATLAASRTTNLIEQGEPPLDALNGGFLPRLRRCGRPRPARGSRRARGTRSTAASVTLPEPGAVPAPPPAPTVVPTHTPAKEHVMTHLQVILGSTRQGRFGDKVAYWFMQHAAAHPDLNAELVDLADWPLPFFNSPVPPAMQEPQDPQAVAWANKISAGDAYVLVTPEYNHGYPAVLKNALDHAVRPWRHKPVGFVGYGGPEPASAPSNSCAKSSSSSR
jgi:hypothetical protein